MFSKTPTKSMKRVRAACFFNSDFTTVSVRVTLLTSRRSSFYFVMRLYWLRHDSQIISWLYMRKIGA